MNKYDKFKNMDLVIGFIKKHYAENHSVQYYADMCNFDKYYFIKLFKEYTGVTPIFYRTNIRVEKAKELLKTTDMNNSKIAEAIGYQGSYYFSRIFKKLQGGHQIGSGNKINEKICNSKKAVS